MSQLGLGCFIRVDNRQDCVRGARIGVDVTVTEQSGTTRKDEGNWSESTVSLLAIGSRLDGLFADDSRAIIMALLFEALILLDPRTLLLVRRPCLIGKGRGSITLLLHSAHLFRVSKGVRDEKWTRCRKKGKVRDVARSAEPVLLSPARNLSHIERQREGGRKLRGTRARTRKDSEIVQGSCFDLL